MLARWASADKPYSGGEIALYCGLPAAAMVLSALRRLGDGGRGHRLRSRGRAMALAPVALLVPHHALLRDASRARGRVVDVVQLGELGRPARVPTRPVLGAGAAGTPREGRPAARQGQRRRAASTPCSPPWCARAGSCSSAAAIVGMVLWINRSRRTPAALAPWLLVGGPVRLLRASRSSPARS